MKYFKNRVFGRVASLSLNWNTRRGKKQNLKITEKNTNTIRSSSFEYAIIECGMKYAYVI